MRSRHEYRFGRDEVRRTRADPAQAGQPARHCAATAGPGRNGVRDRAARQIEIKASLERKGLRIEDFDVAIVAHALANDGILVTGNIKHMAGRPPLATPIEELEGNAFAEIDRTYGVL